VRLTAVLAGTSTTVGQIKMRLIEGLRIPADEAAKLVMFEPFSDFPALDDQVVSRSQSPDVEQCWSPGQGFYADFGSAPADSLDWLNDLCFDTIPVLHRFRHACAPRV
jgi:hypothetical protein